MSLIMCIANESLAGINLYPRWELFHYLAKHNIATVADSVIGLPIKLCTNKGEIFSFDKFGQQGLKFVCVWDPRQGKLDKEIEKQK